MDDGVGGRRPRWIDRRLGDVVVELAERSEARPAGVMRSRPLAAAALLWVVVAAALRAAVPWGFMSNDDHSMMTVAAGSDGGVPDPRVGYQHVLLGRLLVALARAAPEAPWYGIVLIGLELAALIVLTAAVLRLAPRAPRGATLTILVTLVATGAALLVALQFTVVAVLAAAAAVLALVAHATLGRVPASTLVAMSLMLVAASLVRPTGALLGTGIAVASFTVVARWLPAGTRLRVALAIAAASTLVAALVVLEDPVFAPDPAGTAEMRTALYPPGTNPFAPQSESWLAVAERLDPAGLTDNDREMVARWVHPTAVLLAVPEPAPSPADAAVSGLDQARSIAGAMARALRDPRRWAEAVVAVLGQRVMLGLVLGAVIVAALTSDRRRAVVTTVTAAIGVGGVALLSAASRSPEWVAVPSLLVVVIAAHVAASVPAPVDASATGGASRRMMGLLLPVVAVLVVAAGAVRLWGWSSDLEARRAALAEDTAVIAEVLDEGEVVGLWTSGLWRSHDPLAPRPADVVPFATTLVADWPVVLPYHVRRHEGLGMVDWIDALARRDDVLLLASPKKVEAVRVHLAERRGWACPSPVVAAELPSGELLVRAYTGRDGC